MTTHNPYSPPAAQVADASVPAVQRPWQMKVAVRLLWASIVIGLVGIGFEPATISSTIEKLPLFGVVVVLSAMVVMFAMIAVVIVCIARGHRWARIVYSALVALNFIGIYGGVTSSFAISWYYGALYLLGIAVDLTSVILMFSPPANRWFRELTAQRRAA